jgi:Spy/CpxP family protein refolding chaperone
MCQAHMNWWGPGWQYGYGTQAGCGPGSEDYWAGGAFGVRRPLRFLAFKLGLDERQVAELAQILNELKTERAQAAVDHRRTVAGFADALAGDTFDQAKADTAAELRLDSARKLRDAVVRALGRIHALLNPEQRSRLAYLIRTGTLIL